MAGYPSKGAVHTNGLANRVRHGIAYSRIHVTIVVVSCFILAATQVQAQVAKLAHAYTPDTLIGQSMRYLADQIDKGSNGRLKINIIPSGQVGTGQALLELIRKGNIEFALVSALTLASEVPEFRFLGLPYLFKSYEQVDAVLLDSDFSRSLLDSALEQGAFALALFDQGFVDFATNRPMRSPADLKGLKIRTIQDPLRTEVLKASGATPAPLAFGEVYAAIQRGVVDGSEASIESIARLRLNEVTKYVSLTRTYYVADVLLAARGYFTSLSPQLRALVEREARSAARRYAELRRQKERELLASLEKAGAILVKDVDLSRFGADARVLYQKEPWKSIIDTAKKLKCPPGCPLPPICCSK